MVGTQGVHEVHDHERCVRVLGGRDRRRPPERAALSLALLVATRLQDELDTAARVPRQVHLQRDPAPILRTVRRIHEP